MVHSWGAWQHQRRGHGSTKGDLQNAFVTCHHGYFNLWCQSVRSRRKQQRDGEIAKGITHLWVNEVNEEISSLSSTRWNTLPQSVLEEG